MTLYQINWLETIRHAFSDTPEIRIDGQEKIRISSRGYVRRLARLLSVTPEETVGRAITEIHFFPSMFGDHTQRKE